MRYTKPPTNIQQQIEILLGRNLIIPELDRAKKYLETIGYYRLTGYMYHLQESNGTHQFKDNTSFDDIIATYAFDKKLRLLTLNYLERIEVVMRSQITHHYAIPKGFFWYTDPKYFDRPQVMSEELKQKIDAGEIKIERKYIDSHEYVLESVKKNFNNSSELFATRFKSNYNSESLPPCNIAFELVSMGCISRMYESLKNCTEKQNIATALGLTYNILQSWLIFLTNVRNICAHHSRLWNRRMTADRFLIPKKTSQKFNGIVTPDFDRTYYGVLSIIVRLLRKFNPTNSFETKFKHLLKEYPNINIRYMGFPDGWEENPAWI